MTILRNILAVIVGFIAGGLVNSGLVYLGPHVFPPPPGVDVSKPESLAASIHLLEPKHFVFPFLGHALGTLVGALVAYVALGGGRTVAAYVVGGLFFLGGIAACAMIPAPGWFMALDLVVAYLPMAWLATRIGGKFKKDAPPAAPLAG